MYRHPIVIVPGVAGVKLVATDRKTGQKRPVWIEGSLNAVSTATNYLWGKVDEADGLFKSFVDKYVAIEPREGLAACNYLVDMYALAPVSNYFGKLARHICKRLGYVAEQDITAYGYDWRQNPAASPVLEPLRALIKRLRAQNGDRRVIIIGHSMGCVLIEQYMKTYIDWQDDIVHFIGLMGAFDGSSAYSLMSQLCGYNLKMPMPHATVKGIATNSPGIQFLFSRPGGCAGCGSVPQVFVKKTDAAPVHDWALCARFRARAELRSVTSEDVVLDEGVYGGRAPDIAFIMAQRICRDPALVAAGDFGPTLRLLQRSCRRGALQIRAPGAKQGGRGGPVAQLVDRHAAAYRKTAPPPGPQHYRWEVFDVWDAGFGAHARGYRYESSQFVFFDGQTNTLHFTDAFFSRHEELKRLRVVRQSEHPDVLQYAAALQYYMEQRGGPGGQFLLRSCSCSPPGVQHAPWTDPGAKARLCPQKFRDLVDRVHRSGTLERVIYNPRNKNYDEIISARTKKITFRPGCRFKFTSFSGTGRSTPLHAVYDRPIADYSELLLQLPRLTSNNGDGTVLLTSALSDGIPEEYVHDRVVVQSFEHFNCLGDKLLFKLLVELIDGVNGGKI